MTEKRRASKTVRVTFDRELEAMALIKKAMEIAAPYQWDRILKWAVSQYLGTEDHVNEAIVIRKTRVSLTDHK